MEKLLLRPGEAAEGLGVDWSKIYALMANGAVPSIRVGRTVRVPAAALRRWVEEQTQSREQISSRAGQ